MLTGGGKGKYSKSERQSVLEELERRLPGDEGMRVSSSERQSKVE